MNIIEHLREKSVESLYSTASFENFWNSMDTTIKAQLTPLSATNVLNLGDKLGSLFRGNTTERSQSGVSSAGNVWECFVCWYLNICLVGSRTVVIKQSKNFVPHPIKKSLTVKYNNFPSNTESDLVAITFPDKKVYTDSIDNLLQNSTELNDIKLHNRKDELNFLDILNVLCDRHFNEYEVSVIQCKTNWNDNAQIPMLWDMIYSAESFSRNINVGTDGYSIKDLHHFSYAFVTVPTVDLIKFKATSTPVKRVGNLSGGNYWGYDSKSGVASSVKEIFSRNFSNSSTLGIRPRLNQELPNFPNKYMYFRIN